ncbi:metalloendopeptidase [Hahella sp. CCB-MM4]|uniref:pre-peptidase C-terminal domain-containing protein n=1 Tax=Hahella sp. (strain CCB-MM4) TaxID=1926491 RepID=UPI000B9B2D48|nr:pre-peptidase C-terminal domain-containing protein [Hahella sp. CCB-MM4]OZG73213.1 metalloendopeptidase [Hahella sp. CCB-MM4]
MKSTIGYVVVCVLVVLTPITQAIENLITDEQFIYTPREMLTFDVPAYLKRHAPHMLDQAEVITHWSGYYGISPKLLMTIMEMKTGVLSQQNLNNQPYPFGDLSTRSGFSAQVEDIARRLADAYYSKVEDEKANLVFVGSDIASESLAQLLNGNDQNDFGETYQSLFPDQPISASASGIRKFMAYGSELVPPENLLQLPFPVGQDWYFGGAHTNTGSGNYPLSSLDMNDGGYWGSDTSNKWAVASAAGTAIRHSSCFVEVLHDGGWSTTYYHLDNVQFQNRQEVAQNQRLANYANNRSQALCNGGSSTGPHQHFSVKYDGSFYHLDGVYLSGYKVKTGRYSYDSNCNYFWMSKNGSKYCTSNKLYNPGTSDPGTPDVELQNGDVIRDLNADQGDMKYYVLAVPVGSRNLSFGISGGSGDMDMYVDRNNRPTLNDYDCRPYKTTQEETCSYATPQGGDYYVMLHAFSDYSGITFKVGYEYDPEKNPELVNGQVEPDLSASKDNKAYYHMEVPAGARELKIEISGGQGDSDMYVSANKQPTLNSWDCRPYKTTQQEVCSYDEPEQGTYHVMLHAFESYSGISLSASYNDKLTGQTVVLKMAR